MYKTSAKGLPVNQPTTSTDEALTISVERMIQFCYLAQIMQENTATEARDLPFHLTRLGVLLFQTASFLYSLFDDTKDSTNLLKIWRGVEHPYRDDLQQFAKKLKPFKKELSLVRNRIGYHGSLTRNHEKAGLGIFDVESSRGKDFAHCIQDMRQLALRMISWYMSSMDESKRPREFWHEFMVELRWERNQ